MKILIIPEEYYPSKDIYNEYLKVESPYDWVFFHGLFSHAGSYARANNPNKVCFTWEDFKDNVYGRVAGGHIHKSITYKNIDYTGSFDRDCHGEEEDKGYFLYTYNIKKKKVLTSEFIVNEDAHKYITIKYSDIANTPSDDLIASLFEKSKGVKSLRIKIGKDDPITEDRLHALLTISLNIPNLVIDKKDQIDDAAKEAVSEERRQELEERRKEIDNYKNLSFDEVTIKFAKEKFGALISEEDIHSTLENAQ
jgi:hypothetical protein